jgi:transcriptional regulator with XRE-family HTH domain
MKVHEKIKFHREKKGISQDNLAYRLGIEQSQYSRRENGQAKFSIDEIAKIAQILEVELGELFADQTVVFNNSNQSGGHFGQYVQVSEKLIEQYEERLKEKDMIIQLLKEQLNMLKKKEY